MCTAIREGFGSYVRCRGNFAEVKADEQLGGHAERWVAGTQPQTPLSFCSKNSFNEPFARTVPSTRLSAYLDSDRRSELIFSVHCAAPTSSQIGASLCFGRAVPARSRIGRPGDRIVTRGLRAHRTFQVYLAIDHHNVGGELSRVLSPTSTLTRCGGSPRPTYFWA